MFSSEAGLKSSLFNLTPNMATVADFPFTGAIVEIASTSTIADALQTLTEHGILSAPVFDEKTKCVFALFPRQD